MPTPAQIANLALNAVSKAIPGAVHDATLAFDAQLAYDFDTGRYSTSTTTYTGGRAVVATDKPAGDIFPNYVAGPRESLIFLEGFVNVPKENWVLNFNGADWLVTRVQDILDAGSIFYVMAVPK